MNDDEIWSAIDGQRRRVADLLDGLTDEEWTRPSLCAGWSVRDVAAHLTLQQLGPGAAIAMMLRYAGNTNRAIHETSRRRAATAGTAQIAADVRASIGSHRPTFGVTMRETLIDILVHGQDIAVPLGRVLEMPVDAVAVAATRVWTMHWPPPFPARRMLAGRRLVATDTDWSIGTGPEIRGPIAALLLISTGRFAALSQVTGPGTAGLPKR
ncbi:MAG TPA: maleylpyruvate isomerase family mycothiol-dependent enzyme [Micromonosporaceae bacterium]